METNTEMSSKLKREIHMSFAITEEEAAALKQLADGRGVSQAGWIRLQIHNSVSKGKN
ncbi:MAG: hypothetical protein RE472_05325 [Thermoplasmatales archaeon]|jgi:hypothetical protein|nr:hypothetical protein [Candidatus Thermoplasmatota archaeon]WMT48499.1 MAG: hypothetical protein RE472_05325 [Thermoplasmatales archaeon]